MKGSMDTKSETLEPRLDKFFGLFSPTLELAQNLIRARTNPQELVLLLCARLDALASCIAREDQSNRRSFVELLVKYGGDRDFMQSVSVGDLYYELGFHRWLAEGMIPKPGRLVRFSRLDDPIIALLDRSRIALTVEAAERLLTRIMKVAGTNYRCRPGQPRRKPMFAKPATIIGKLEAEFRHVRDSDVRNHIGQAIQPLLNDMTIAGLLYSKFRNNSVHGLRVEFDEEKFFRSTSPFWQPLYSEYYPPFWTVQFPAAYLLELLRNCMKTLRGKMLATGKLPPDVHYHAFEPGLRTEFLDDALLPNAAELRLQSR
jgi:hypothetical protein